MEELTSEGIWDCGARIREVAKFDFEQAHILQDDLVIAALRVIAGGVALSHVVARDVLAAIDVDFPRHCA